MINEQQVESWTQARGVETKHRNTSTASGTYQVTATADMGKLHEINSKKDLLVEGGTGSSVSASSGTLWAAATFPRYWRPMQGRESLGYETLDSSSFASSNPLTISKIED